MGKIRADIQDIFDYKNVCLTEEGGVKTNTQALIHIGAVIGMADLNHYNIRTWVLRMQMMKFCAMPVVTKESGPWWPSEHQLRQHIGLRLTVPEEPQSAFDAWLVRMLKKQADTGHPAIPLH